MKLHILFLLLLSSIAHAMDTNGQLLPLGYYAGTIHMRHNPEAHTITASRTVTTTLGHSILILAQKDISNSTPATKLRTTVFLDGEPFPLKDDPVDEEFAQQFERTLIKHFAQAIAQVESQLSILPIN